MTVMTTTEDIRDWPTSSHAAVLDASRIDSGWSCARLASGSRISRAADPDAPFLWPRTADLHGPNETLPKLPAAAYSLIRLHAKHMSRLSRGSNVATSDLRYLHHLVNVSEAVTTGETGFASGLSALAMLTALRGGDAAAVHYSIDPFQPAFNNDGLRAVQLYERRVREQARTPARFVHLNATAGFGLAWLLRQRTCFDLFFMDDGHKFDENMVELYFVAKLLAVGGVLVLHDDWMESVQATVAFIGTNLRFLERVPRRLKGFTVFVKRFPDNREWDHFVTFKWVTIVQSVHTPPVHSAPLRSLHCVRVPQVDQLHAALVAAAAPVAAHAAVRQPGVPDGEGHQGIQVVQAARDQHQEGLPGRVGARAVQRDVQRLLIRWLVGGAHCASV